MRARRKIRDQTGRFEIRHATLVNLQREIDKARRRYPSNENLLKSYQEFSTRLVQALESHHAGHTTAVDVYGKALICAAMAIRILEEGDGRFRYGNSGPRLGLVGLTQIDLK